MIIYVQFSFHDQILNLKSKNIPLYFPSFLILYRNERNISDSKTIRKYENKKNFSKGKSFQEFASSEIETKIARNKSNLIVIQQPSSN